VPELWEWTIAKAKASNIDLLFNSRVPLAFRPTYMFIQQAIVPLVLCQLSWLIIEKPINGLKRYFEYKTGSPLSVSKEDVALKRISADHK